MIKAKILIVEDEAIVAEDIRGHLRSLGYTVLDSVTTGKQAIKKVEEGHPDIVLMDIKLQGKMDGVETAEHIRRNFNIPIVYLTAFSDDQTLERAKITEPFGYILKPFEERELHTTIEMALYKHLMERKLHQTEQRLATILRSIGDAVVASDAQGIVTFMNPVAESLTGWKREDALGKPLGDVFTTVKDESQEGGKKRSKRHVQEPAAGYLGNGTMLVGKQGHHVPIEQIVASMIDDDGTVAGTVSAFRDITERKRAEELLRESEERYRELFENASDIVFTLDLQGVVTSVNRAAEIVTGYTADELIGAPATHLVAPEYRQMVSQMQNLKLSRSSRTVYELDLITKDRRRVTVEINSRWTYKEGKVAGIQGIARDTTDRKQAEAALRESEERYRAVSELVSDYVYAYRVGPDGVTQREWTTEAFTRITGFAQEKLDSLGGWKSLVHPEDSDIARKRLDRLLSGFPDVSEFRVVTKGGDVRWMRDYARPVQDGEQKKTVRIYGAAQDITESKRAEEALRESQARMAGIIGSAMDSIITLDEEQRVVLFNDSAEKMFLYSRKEILGQRIDRLLPERFRNAHREHIPTFGTTGVTKRSMGLFGPVSGLRANGEEFLVEASISQIEVAGRKLYTVILRDIMERKRIENALRESEERYRRLFEEDLSGAYVATPEGRIIACNPAFARIFGFPSVEAAMKCNILSLYPVAAQRHHFLDLLCRKKKLEYFEKDLHRSDGTPIRVVENAIGTFGRNGELVEYKGYLFDDTERSALEDQLRQSQKMESLGILAGGIAHDFNNILNNILGFAVQLKKYTHDGARVLKYSETIEKSASRGAELAGQLLSFVRKKKREDAPTDVAPIIDEVMALCTEIFPRNLVIEKRVAPDLSHVMGDRGSLYEVLLNLCLNARDAMEGHSGNGKLLVEARNVTVGEDMPVAIIAGQGDPSIEIKVSDTGTGIPRNIREKIFDPFFTTKEKGKGTGLGLAVVYNTVRAHKGGIAVDSEEGKGSTFRIYIPSIDTGNGAAGPSSHRKPGMGSNELILLVDDEETMRELGKELLEEQGYRVLLAENGSEALQIYRKKSDEIALVILDLIMPKMNGGQTYQEMKKINATLKAFFCTGLASDSEISALPAQERLRTLQKPFRSDELLKLVQEVLVSTHQEEHRQ